MAILSTLDVLRTTPDPENVAEAVFGPEDVQRSDIVILDEFPDGPYFDLFQLASGKRPTRIADWAHSRNSDSGSGRAVARILADRVIISLAGAANPLWSDKVKIDCGLQNESVLQVFVRRVFDLYNIPRTRQWDGSGSVASGLSVLPPTPSTLNVSVVVRRNSRRLVGLDGQLFDTAKTRFSHVANIRLVDFEGMPFQDQIEIARDRNVIVGITGPASHM
jgi:EGF domain-specific O-GlcNAc transferase